MTGSRLLVQRGIADAVRTRLAQRLAAVRVGPAADPLRHGAAHRQTQRRACRSRVEAIAAARKWSFAADR